MADETSPGYTTMAPKIYISKKKEIIHKFTLKIKSNQLDSEVPLVVISPPVCTLVLIYII